MNKVALVTGSSKGLGFQIAKELASIGYKIILTGRSKESLSLVHSKLINPEKHIIFSGDLLEKENLKKLCAIPYMPDVIIHCLGGKVEGDEQPIQSEILIKSVALNLGVAVALNSYYLPLMQKEGKGRIIHISSDASETGRSAPGYAAAKAAINAYVKSTARFYAKNNIMICSVLPGIFLYSDSPWDKKRISNLEYFEARMKEQPLGRFLSTEEISEMIVKIADSDCMAYSGSLIKLAGAE
ncbi:MAG: SDR family oxidoreductase [Coxiellaceae bacterium]|nr:SDR family oxidoreductase [Coxiellaceae bacterium]